MSQQFSLAEIFGGAIWLASGVAVAGYTYDAFKGSYTQFPGPGGGSGSGFGGTAIPFNSEATGQKAAHDVERKIPLIGGPLANASQWLQNFFSGGTGSDSLTDHEIKRLESLPAPPKQLVTILKNAPTGKKADAANNLARWARQNGWKSSDINAFIRYLGIKVF